MRNALSAGVLYACGMDKLPRLQGCAHPLHQSERERERKRKREGEREKQREKERERERERGREREREFIFKRNDGCLGTIDI